MHTFAVFLCVPVFMSWCVPMSHVQPSCSYTFYYGPSYLIERNDAMTSGPKSEGQPPPTLHAITSKYGTLPAMLAGQSALKCQWQTLWLTTCSGWPQILMGMAALLMLKQPAEFADVVLYLLLTAQGRPESRWPPRYLGLVLQSPALELCQFHRFLEFWRSPPPLVERVRGHHPCCNLQVRLQSSMTSGRKCPHGLLNRNKIF